MGINEKYNFQCDCVSNWSCIEPPYAGIPYFMDEQVGICTYH